MKDRKVSIAIGFFQKKFGDKAALDIAKEIGTDGVDFDLLLFDYTKEESIYAKGDAAVEEYFTGIRKYAEGLGLEIAQTHGRLKGFVNIPEADDALVENARLDCIATRALGAKYCVMHTTTTIHMGRDAAPELMHRLNYDMFTRILPFAKEQGIKIATETFGDATKLDCIDFFGDCKEFIDGYERIVSGSDCADSLCVCMDTGHTNKATRYQNNPPVGEVIRRLGSKIEVLHLNDNDTLTDQHKIPMTGTVDWEDVMNALDEIGYNGWYNLECVLKHFGEDFAIEEARFAIKVIRQILKTRYGEKQRR